MNRGTRWVLVGMIAAFLTLIAVFAVMFYSGWMCELRPRCIS